MARLQPIHEMFNLAIKGTEAQIQKAVSNFAKKEHARVMGTPPKPSNFTQTIDGRLGAPIDSIKFNGVAVFRYARLDIVVRAAFLALIDKSPILTGEYIRGHTLFMDGVAVLSGAPGGIPNANASWFQGWRPGMELVIANSVPYSRKIEIGSMTMSVPGTDHVYEQAQQVLQRRYGNVANIRFTFRGVVGGHNAGLSSARAKNKSRGDNNRFPALVIREK